MFIGHVPAGFLWTEFFMTVSKQATIVLPRSRILLIGICSSLIPDLDLFYFYIIDHRKNLHHSYWTHIPLFWIAAFSIWILAAYAFKQSKLLAVGIISGSNILLHLALDTITGKIGWLYPFSNIDIVLVNVPAVHEWWVWNFVLHWTFFIEITLFVTAFYVFLSNRHKHVIVK